MGYSAENRKHPEHNPTDCITCDQSEVCELIIDSEREPMSTISRDTFEKMDQDSKLCVLFDYIQDIQCAAPKRVRDRDIKCARQTIECMDKFDKISDAQRKTQIVSTGITFIGSFIGGWAAVWTAFKFNLIGG